MEMWFIVGLLALIELFIVVRIPLALFDGAVPLNPAGWFGYAEYLDVTVERRNSPRTYWFIVSLATALAMLFGVFIYLIATRTAT
ncbi:MAG TPA: hypothetical protein VLX67_04645 [Stellaceae bacterium]|nr:hypothetical protein [Stellaceae bacterium]